MNGKVTVFGENFRVFYAKKDCPFFVFSCPFYVSTDFQRFCFFAQHFQWTCPVTI